MLSRKTNPGVDPWQFHLARGIKTTPQGVDILSNSVPLDGPDVSIPTIDPEITRGKKISRPDAAGVKDTSP